MVKREIKIKSSLSQKLNVIKVEPSLSATTLLLLNLICCTSIQVIGRCIVLIYEAHILIREEC